MQIIGKNPVIEALKAKLEIKKIYIKKGILIDSKVTFIIDECNKINIPINYVSKRYLNKLSEIPIHQGIVAIVKELKEVNINDLLSLDNPFFVYIRDAQNEGNIGSILRTAEACGVNAIILPNKIKSSPVIARTSMGASNYVPLINANLFSTIKLMKKNNIKVVGIELKTDKAYFDIDLKGGVLLIIGGEDRSLSDEILNKCDEVVKIPMKGNINSLNMAIAASLVMYEKIRQEG